MYVIITFMDELRKIVAKNITAYRKNAGLTQAQLAEKLNYSDKAVSKWERAEGLPDVYILKELARIFNTTVDDLISASPRPSTLQPRPRINKIVLTLLSVGLVWLIATLAFAILHWTDTRFPAWHCFIYALPTTGVVLIVFSALWSKRKHLLAIANSFFVWSAALTVFLTILQSEGWLIFIVAIPLQALIILGPFIKNKKAAKVHAESKEDAQ